MKKLTKEQFIEKAKLIHGDKYNYDKIIYINSKHKIKIFCNNHFGYFLQSPDKHLSKRGCYSCNKKKASLKITKTNDNFIKDAKKIHGDKYNYEKINYKNAYTKIEIFCNIHLEYFWQAPTHHLQGKECPLCGNKKISLKLSKSTKKFIEDAIKIHNNKYDYTKTNYINCFTNVYIICPNHGKFKQTPSSHLRGCGCSKCAPNISKKETKWLNGINIPKSNRNLTVKLKNKRINVDALVDNNIYEFYGDFWHGNPNIYKAEEINPATKTTFGELYTKTLERENLIKSAGYNLITIWESEFDRMNKV